MALQPEGRVGPTIQPTEEIEAGMVGGEEVGEEQKLEGSMKTSLTIQVMGRTPPIYQPKMELTTVSTRKEQNLVMYAAI